MLEENVKNKTKNTKKFKQGEKKINSSLGLLQYFTGGKKKLISTNWHC